MTRRKDTLDPSGELAVRTEYEIRRSRLETLANSVRNACEAVLRAKQVPYHSVKRRVKSLSSTLEKINRKKYKASLDRVEDLVGVRVICLYPKHIDSIVAHLEKEFSVLEKSDKRPKPSTTKFGYSSVHLICTVENTTRARLPEYAGTENFRFEIRVRTILQEAWAEIEHGLIYKSEAAAPEDIERQIVRVSAVLEMADEDFQRVYDLRQEYASRLRETDLTALQDEPLNVDSLLEVIRRRYAWAEGWQEITQEKTGPYLTRLVSDMQSLGVTTVRQLLALIDKWYAEEYRESEKGYLVATGQISPAESGDAGYLISGDRPWHNRTRQYFLPIAQLRGILGREFPQYREESWGELDED